MKVKAFCHVGALALALPFFASLSASARDEIVCEYAFTSHIQGGVSDGTYLYVVAKTEVLKADLSGKTIRSVKTSSSHHGDPTYLNGKLYVPVTKGDFSVLGASECFVEVYDAETLTLAKTYGPLPEPIYGAGGMTYYNGSFYVVGGLPDDGKENLIFEYVEEDGRFRFVACHRLPIFTGKGIQTATVVDDRFWFGIDVPYEGGSAQNPTGTLICSPDFADFHRTDFVGTWGIIQIGDDIGRIPYSSSQCRVVFDCQDFTQAYKVGFIAGRADCETISAQPLGVNELIVGAAASCTGEVAVSTAVTVAEKASVGTFAGGFGAVRLAGGSLSFTKTGGGEMLRVGVKNSTSRTAELSGWGTVSAASGSLSVYDRIVADGGPAGGTLDLTAFGNVNESTTPSSAVAPGWYARNAGCVLLPVRSTAVTDSKLQNAVNSSLAGLRVAVLAADRWDYPVLTGFAEPRTIWRVGSSSSFSSASLTFVHDFLAENVSGAVTLLRHDGSGWTALRTLTDAEIAAGQFTVSNLAKTSDATWNLGYFAVATAQAGTVFYGNTSAALNSATGWFTDPECSTASGSAPCSSGNPAAPNIYVVRGKLGTKVAGGLTFAGDVLQLGDASTAGSATLNVGTLTIPHCRFYGGSLELNGDGTEKFAGAYELLRSANDIKFGTQYVSGSDRNVDLCGTFSSAVNVTVQGAASYKANFAGTTQILLSGDFSGFCGSFRFSKPSNGSADRPLYVALTAPTAFGSTDCPRPDAIVLTEACVLRISSDVNQSAARGLTLELSDGEYVVIDTAAYDDVTLSAPIACAAAGAIVKTGAGTLTLNGRCEVADVRVDSGELAFGEQAEFATPTVVTVAAEASVSGKVPSNVTVVRSGMLYWQGGGADTLLTTAENWQGGVAPSLADNDKPVGVLGGTWATVNTAARFPSLEFLVDGFTFDGAQTLTLGAGGLQLCEGGDYRFDAPLAATGTLDLKSESGVTVSLTGDNTGLAGGVAVSNVHLRVGGPHPLGTTSGTVTLYYGSESTWSTNTAGEAIVIAAAPGATVTQDLKLTPSVKTTTPRFSYRAEAGSTNVFAGFNITGIGGSNYGRFEFESDSRTTFGSFCGNSVTRIDLSGGGEVEFAGWTTPSGNLRLGALNFCGDGLRAIVSSPAVANNGLTVGAQAELRLGVAEAFPPAKAKSGSTTRIDGTLDLDGHDQSLTDLVGSGLIVSRSAPATLTPQGGGALDMAFGTGVSLTLGDGTWTLGGASSTTGRLTLGGAASVSFTGEGSWGYGEIDFTGTATLGLADGTTQYAAALYKNGVKLADGTYGRGTDAAVAAGISDRFVGTGVLLVGVEPPTPPGPGPEPVVDTGFIDLKEDRTITSEETEADPTLLTTNYTSSTGATLTFSVTSGKPFEVKGYLTGNLRVIKTGKGVLTIGCTTNDYSGGTRIKQYTVQIPAGTTVPGTGALGTGTLEIQTDDSNANGRLALTSAVGDGTVPNDIHIIGTAETDDGHQTAYGNVSVAFKPGEVVFSGEITADVGSGFSLSTSGVNGNLRFTGGINATEAKIYPTAYKSSSVIFDCNVTAAVVDCSFYGQNHYGKTVLAAGKTFDVGELKVGHQSAQVNGALSEDCVISWPLVDSYTLADDCSVLTLGANETVAGLTGASMTSAQAASDGISLTATGKTLTLRPTAALAECYARVDGSLSLVLDAANKANVQSFVRRTNATTGLIDVRKGVFRIGTGASFPNVTAVTVGAQGTLDIATTAAQPVSVQTELRVATGAVLNIPSGSTLTVRSLYLDGVQVSAAAVPVTGGGTLAVTSGPAPSKVLEIRSGCVTTNDLSFVTDASKLVIDYGTLRYTGAATAIPGLTLDPSLAYRASVISNAADLTVGPIVNNDAKKGALMKYGAGTLTLGGTGSLTLKGYGPRNGNTKTKTLVDGNSPDSNFATLTVNEGELAIGKAGDAANAPQITLHGQQSASGWIAGIAAGGADLRGDATVSFRNGVVNDASSICAGYYHPNGATSVGATSTLTLRWCGGTTYGYSLYGRFIETQASTVYGRTDILIESGAAYFSGNAYVCHGRGTVGEANLSRLAVSGGLLSVAGDLFASAPANYAGSDVLISLSGGELFVDGKVDLLSNTSTASSSFKNQRVRLQLDPNGLLRCGELMRSGDASYYTETGCLFGNGGEFRPQDASKSLSTLAHVYASTNGLVVSTADLDPTEVYEIAQPVENEPGLAADGGLVKKGAGTLKLSAANTFTGPVRVEAGVLLLPTAASVPETADLYLTTGASLQIPSGASVTVARAFVDGVQVAAAAVPVTGGGALTVTQEPRPTVEPLEIRSGCVTTNDLSFVTDASRLVIDYGTLRYTGAATTIPGLTLDPSVRYRASVISNAANLTVGPIVNNDATKGAILKYGAGKLTLGGNQALTLKGYAEKDANTKTKKLVNGNSPDSNLTTLTANEGELAIGKAGDAANAPFLTLHGGTSSMYVGGVAAGGSDMRDSVTVSFDNGVVTNASNFYAGYLYPYTATENKVMTIRWRGGRTYGTALYGKVSNNSTEQAKGRAEFLMEAGEAVFSGNGYLCHSKGGGEASAVLLRVSGGRMAFGGDLLCSRLETTRGSDVDIDLCGGELAVAGTVNFGSVTTYNSGWVKQSVRLVAHAGSLFRYGSLVRTCDNRYTQIGVLYGNGGELRPLSAATSLSTLAHVYASTNGLVVSTADLASTDVYEIAQPVENEPGLAADGGLVKKGAGTLKLSAANTFTGPVRVEAGVLLLPTAAAVPETADLYLTTGATLQIPSGVSVTVARAFVDGVQVAAAAVPVTGGGTLTATQDPSLRNVYFDSAAAAGGDGSAEHPFRTLSGFDFAQIPAGGTVNLKCGSVFSGPVTVRGLCGTADEPVEIRAWGAGARPVLEGNDAIGTNVLTLADCDYLTVSGLEIRDTVGQVPTNRCGVAVFVSESDTDVVRVSHGIVLTNLYVHSIRGLTAGSNDSADLKRTGGIQAWSSASSRFDGLEIVDNVITDVDSTGIAIWRRPVIGGTPTPSPWEKADEFARTAHTNVRIARNDVSDIGKNAIVVRNLMGGVIERNVVHDTAMRTLRDNYVVGGNAIFTSYVDGTVVQYNEGYRNCANASDGAFLDADLQSKDTVWQYNYSHDNRFGLFTCCTYKKDNPIVRGNLSVNDQGAHHGVVALNYVCKGLQFYNNTIITGPTTTNVFDLFSNSTGHYYRVYNNIIYNRSPYARINCPVIEDKENGDWKDNLVFNAPGAQIVSSGAYNPLTDYDGAVVSTADPKFLWLPAETLAGRSGWAAVEVAIPADDSPVFGLGEPTDLGTDILGNRWSQTLGCVARVLPGGAWVSPSSGAWSQAANWRDESVPSGTSDVDVFGEQGSDADNPIVVSVDGDFTAGEIQVSGSNYRLAGSKALTLGSGTVAGALNVTRQTSTLDVSVPLVAPAGVTVNGFTSEAAAYSAGRVDWNAPSLTGGALRLGAGVTTFATPAALAFVTAADRLVLGRGTAAFACGSLTLPGLTLGFDGMNGLSVADGETLTLSTVAPLGEGYYGLFKCGPGTLKFAGTGTSVLGGGEFRKCESAADDVSGMSANGNAPTNGLMSLTVADGTVVLGTAGDPSDAPTVTVANGLAVGCKSGPKGVEPTSGALVVNNGTLDVTNGTFYLGYYAGRTDDVGTAEPSLTVNGGRVRMAGDFRVNYANNSSRIKCTPTVTINGGEVETLGTVGTGDCTIGKDYPVTFNMNGGCWHVAGNFYTSARSSASPLVFNGNGGRLVVDKTFDPNYNQAQGSNYNNFHFNTNFTLRTKKIVPTKKNDRARVTFAKATWEVPSGMGRLEGLGKAVFDKGGLTLNLEDVEPFTFNQKLQGDGFIYVYGTGRVEFGPESTNTTTKVYTGRIDIHDGLRAVLNESTAGMKFTMRSGTELTAEGAAAAHTVELQSGARLELPAAATLAVSVNLTADAGTVEVVPPGYGTYTQLLYKAAGSSSVDATKFVLAAGESAQLKNVELVNVDDTWKGVAMTFAKIQSFDVAQDVGDFALDPGVRFKLDAGFAADTFLFPACETGFDLNGTARLVVRESLSVAAGGSVVLDPTLGLSRNPKARRMPVMKVQGLTDATLAKFRVADAYAKRWQIVRNGDEVWLERSQRGLMLVIGGTPTPVANTTDVYLLIGQSNMAGRGFLTNGWDIVSSERVLKMNFEGTWVEGTEPLHYDKPSVAGVGPGGTFARAMADADRRATVALVPAAFGGTSLSQWQPGAAKIDGSSEACNLYSNALLRTRAALEELPNARLAGVIWHQGEGDSGNKGSADAYFGRFTNVVRRLRADLNAPNLPFVAGELSEFSKNAYKGTVNEALHSATNVLGHYGVVSSAGLTSNPDVVHFNTESQRKLGFRYADKMKELQKK